MRLLRAPLTLTLAALVGAPLQAQVARDATELHLLLDRLQVLGSVLYIAAHPDDENTSLLTYLSRGRKLRAGYLSLTRGTGGQNLIGPELGDPLAAIRTQELLAARRVDGTEQYFTHALDFGFSKTAEETLKLWDRERVLADMVFVIRRFRPDVLVTRFAPDTPGHGHHQASAILAREAFEAAGDPKRFPEQLAHHPAWQPKRLLFNAFRPQPAPGAISLDLGQYDPLLGKSYAELSAESRSQHRSQGFGAVPFRGTRPDQFEPVAGAAPEKDILDGVITDWSRIPGASEVQRLLREARDAYRPGQPEAVLPPLLQAMGAMDRLPRDPWVDHKREEVREAIRSAAGIWVEAMADRPAVAPGDPITVSATALARGKALVKLVSVQIDALAQAAPNQPLAPNRPHKQDLKVVFPAGTPATQPLWMRPDDDARLRGLGEAPPVLEATFRLELAGAPLTLTVPVCFRFRDPALGERQQPLVVLPSVMVNPEQPVQVFGDKASREVAFTVIAGAPGVQGALELEVPKGWKVEPAQLPFALGKPFEEQVLKARITPPAAPGQGALRVKVRMGGRVLDAQGLERVDYPHIPLQTLFPASQVKLTRVDLRHDGRRIGYVMGAGDELPQCLRPLGYTVELLTDDQLAGADLRGYDAIVVGIRAFNTRPRLAHLKARLADYVAQGGTEVVLYQTNAGLVTEPIAPLPLKVGRGRVVDERAPMQLLAPDHPVLTWPNRITPADFEGWIQERGLYFAETWDPAFKPIFGIRDADEPVQQGALLIAPHGKGHVVYTGLAFFRQFPDGVPGAYRLFANLLALSSQARPR